MKVLHYNVNSVSDLFRKGQEHLVHPFLNDNSRDTFKLYDKYGLNKNAVYDRTGNIPHYLNMSDWHSMPEYDCNFNKSFEEITNERAKQLVSYGKRIKVCWSGGIDSTYALFVLNQYAAPGQVTAYGSYISVIESGDVFDKFIKNNIDYDIRVSPNQFSKKEDDDSIWVTGFQGNQLFGPTDDYFATSNKPFLFHHTLGTPDTIYESYLNHVDPGVLNFLQPAIDKSPRKIETVNDLRWYCIFNLDWYNGLYDMLSDMPTSRMNDIHHFFNTVDFQKWAITTKEPFTKIKGNPNTHRWQMRDRLADFGLVNYAKNKSKTVSTFSTIHSNWLFLLDDKHHIHIRSIH
jgi:hypothetical protein